MSGDSEAIEHALAELAASVAAQLQGDGWVRHDIDPRGYVLVMTKPVRDGVLAGVEVRVSSLRWPRKWPETVDVGFGAGFEPALDLMPLVTLSPQAILVSESDESGEPDLSIEIAGAGAVPAVAARLSAAIRDHGVGFAERYDVDAFDVELAGSPRCGW